MARGRDYQGQYWADGETAFHSKRKSAQNEIRKNLKRIEIWAKFADTRGEKAASQAVREIAALQSDSERQERIIAEMDARIAEWEAGRAAEAA